MAWSDQRLRNRLQRLEQEARQHPHRHALRLGAYIVLGYLWPLLTLMFCALGMALVLSLFFAAWDVAGVRGVLAWLVLASLVPVVGYFVISAIWQKPGPLPGNPLSQQDAPELFALIEQVRTRCQGPRLDQVRLDSRINAAIHYRRRHELWGRPEYCLVLGVPLMAALTPEDLRCVIAHEFGHLSGSVDPFGGWVYRVVRTWQNLIESPTGKRTIHDRVVGWFARWYVPWLMTATVPARRLHEYQADRTSADAEGAENAARALAALDWAGYRLGRSFTPAIWHEAAQVELPPGDFVQRVVGFWATPVEQTVIDAWRKYERSRRGQVADEHPSLMERMAALSAAGLLGQAPSGSAVQGVPASMAPEGSALMLLGAYREKAIRQANVGWKAQVIASWRRAHAIAQYQAREAREEDAASPQVAADRAWTQIQADPRYRDPIAVRGLIEAFLEQYADHAEANFDYGRLLLSEDDDAGRQYLEKAMTSDHNYGLACLNVLLDRYRDAGRDQEADQVRQQMDTLEKARSTLRRHLYRLGRREQLTPHDLSGRRLRAVWSVLNRFPQVSQAYLAKRSAGAAGHRPEYVLAVRPRAQARGIERRVLSGLAESLPIPCTIVVLRWWNRRLWQRFQAVCPVAIFQDVP